jgi:hypothetical protein
MNRVAVAHFMRTWKITKYTIQDNLIAIEMRTGYRHNIRLESTSLPCHSGFFNVLFTITYTECDPKVFRRVVLKEYCALHLAADTVNT